MKTQSLTFAKNMFGNLSPEYINRIENYLENPTVHNWDDVSGIIINANGKMRTIWQAVIGELPTFPRTGRAEDFAGNVVKEWERIPSPKIVIQAIQNNVYSIIQTN